MSDAHDRVWGGRGCPAHILGAESELIRDKIGSGNCYVFQDLGIPIKLVCGNNDGDRHGLARNFSCGGGWLKTVCSYCQNKIRLDARTFEAVMQAEYEKD